jgi:hypothetical protein
LRKIITGGIAVALGVATAVAGGAFAAGGQPIAFVNGGGQILADPTQQGGGAGDTIAFTAQELVAYDGEDGNARGKLQSVPRGESDQTAKFHGVVTCANIDGQELGTATFGGHNRDDATQLFQVRVTDGGPGGTDMIALIYPADGDNPCEDDSEADGLTLARGNVTIHKQDGPPEQ